MVHKKSEYGLQFLRLSNDVRAQIWRENFRFREAQKRLNLSDHYWRYQLIDDQCDCDKDSNILNEPIRPNKTSATSKTQNEDKGVETIETKVIEHQFLSENNNAPLETTVKQNPLHKASEETVGSNASKTANSLQSSSPTERSNLNHNNEVSRGSYNIKEILSYSQNEKSDQVIDDVPSVHSRLNRSPTRNALKKFLSEERAVPVFAAFGWNDSDKDVGDQKTYNVRAPVGQVHTSALLASGNRLKELESHLAMALKKRQQRSHLHQGPVNLSSIWMTEYQENFSKGQREPLVRNTFARPIVWRFT